MLNSLLEKTRRLNLILLNRKDRVSFDELCNVIADILEVNVYIINTEGKVLGYKMVRESIGYLLSNVEAGELFFPKEHNENLLKFEKPVTNLEEELVRKTFVGDEDSYDKQICIIPLFFNNKRIGTFILARKGEPFDLEDMILSENAATVIAMEIKRAYDLKEAARKRDIETVKMAIDSLSYSEKDAIENVFKELDSEEGLIVASKIADKYSITRSVIVNAIRKLESAGVIESRSLGMKGTYLKILNIQLLNEL